MIRSPLPPPRRRPRPPPATSLAASRKVAGSASILRWHFERDGGLDPRSRRCGRLDVARREPGRRRRIFNWRSARAGARWRPAAAAASPAFAASVTSMRGPGVRQAARGRAPNNSSTSITIAACHRRGGPGALQVRRLRFHKQPIGEPLAAARALRPCLAHLLAAMHGVRLRALIGERRGTAADASGVADDGADGGPRPRRGR